MSNIPPNINDNNNNNPEENDKYKKKVELIFEILKRRYDSAIERRHFLDDKASNLIVYVTIITAIIIIIIGLGTFVILEKITNEVVYILYFTGIGSLILSLIFSLLVIRTKKFKADSNIENLKEYFQDNNRWTYEQIIIRHIDIMFDSIPILDNENIKKTNLIQLSWTLLVGGIILLTAFYSLLFYLIHGL